MSSLGSIWRQTRRQNRFGHGIIALAYCHLISMWWVLPPHPLPFPCDFDSPAIFSLPRATLNSPSTHAHPSWAVIPLHLASRPATSIQRRTPMMTGKSRHHADTKGPQYAITASNDMSIAQAEWKARRRSSAGACSCRSYPSVSAAQGCAFRAQGYVTFACMIPSFHSPTDVPGALAQWIGMKSNTAVACSC